MCFACGYQTINHHLKIEYKHKNKTGVDCSFGSLTFPVCTLRCFNSLNTHTLIHKLHLHLCSKYGDLHTHSLNVCSKHGDLYTHTYTHELHCMCAPNTSVLCSKTANTGKCYLTCVLYASSKNERVCIGK